jgi:hypothetical protein
MNRFLLAYADKPTSLVVVDLDEQIIRDSPAAGRIRGSAAMSVSRQSGFLQIAGYDGLDWFCCLPILGAIDPVRLVGRAERVASPRDGRVWSRRKDQLVEVDVISREVTDRVSIERDTVLRLWAALPGGFLVTGVSGGLELLATATGSFSPLGADCFLAASGRRVAVTSGRRDLILTGLDGEIASIEAPVGTEWGGDAVFGPGGTRIAVVLHTSGSLLYDDWFREGIHITQLLASRNSVPDHNFVCVINAETGAIMDVSQSMETYISGLVWIDRTMLIFMITSLDGLWTYDYEARTTQRLDLSRKVLPLLDLNKSDFSD